MSLTDWLTRRGLQEYDEVLRSEGFEDLEGLADLTEANLRELGLKMAHAKRLLKALREGSVETGATAGNTSASAVNPAALTTADLAALRTLKLFLSYGRDDHATEVKALRDALRARGHEVWFDEEQLGTGLDWDQCIEKGLQWCDRVVLTMTPHSVRRPDGYCLNEIAKALELRKLIIPVLLVEVPQGAPTSICRIQYLDWRDAVPAAEKAERFSQRLARLCEAIEEDKLDFEGGQQWLIRHLQPINFNGDLQRHVARFVGRRGLEQRLRDWLRNPAAPQVLWLTGPPGFGKSAVAAWLAHHWAQCGAMHFCQAGILDKADPVRAILSISYQLSQRMTDYALRLSSLSLEELVDPRDANGNSKEPNPRTLFDQLLVRPLSSDFPVPDEAYMVIIDGLDEASQPGGSNKLAEIVAADWGRLPRWLRLIVSSRPEPEVRQWLKSFPVLSLSREDPEQHADLEAFLRAEFEHAGRKVTEQAVQRILSASGGAFHYVKLLLEDISQDRCDPEDPTDLPSGLMAYYTQSFKRRFSELTAYSTECRPLLALMLASPDPLPLELMARSEGLNVFEVRDRLQRLGSMVQIDPAPPRWDASWDTVQFTHATLRTWLTELDDWRAPVAEQFSVQPDAKKLSEQTRYIWRDAGLETVSLSADELLAVTVLPSGRAGVWFMNWDIGVKPSYLSAAKWGADALKGPGLYGLCFDGMPIYLGSYLGAGIGGAYANGDLAVARLWAHVGAFTVRGHRVHIGAGSLKALSRDLGPNHPMVAGFLSATEPEFLHRDQGNLAPLKRLKFAASKGDLFFDPLATPADVLKRFTLVYTRCNLPSRLGARYLKEHIQSAEERLIKRLSPPCNSTQIEPGATPASIAAKDLPALLEQELRTQASFSMTVGA